MALIGICCWDTEENGRSTYTEKTLKSLLDTVDFTRHRLVVADNNSCYKTKRILKFYQHVIPGMVVITLKENIGTAKAINKCWAKKDNGEHVIKMDNDVDIMEVGWVDLMEECLSRDPKLGIVSLKRGDLEEHPDHENTWYKSTLKMLPHERGQRWIVVERVSHCMGTCQMYNSALIDKIGGLSQMDGLYGFDDSLAAARCQKAGFYSAFVHGVEIIHLDKGGDDYTKWKQVYAGEMMEKFNQYKKEYLDGTRDIYDPL